MKDQKLFDYVLILGDSSMILGHRLSELCGHGPNLETDIALTNISLDLFGQVRNYFQYAAKLWDEGKTEDDIAYLRLEHDYRNVKLVEQPNVNFAHVIARQFFYDVFHELLLTELMSSQDKMISAIANKSIKEVRYHERFSSEWVKRLGDGTALSHNKVQEAINFLYTYTDELFLMTEVEEEMSDVGIGVDLNLIKPLWENRVQQVLSEATLSIPDHIWNQQSGKEGNHTEQMGFILADFQYMQRAYPDMEW